MTLLVTIQYRKTVQSVWLYIITSGVIGFHVDQGVFQSAVFTEKVKLYHARQHVCQEDQLA